MGRRSKYFEGFQKGYENGKLNVVADIDYYVQNRMKKSKARDKLIEYLDTHYKDYLPRFGTIEPTEYEKKHCYCSTFRYRDIDVDIFDDDYGQQFYFYYKGSSYSCGSFNPDYEECVKYVIDKDLDEIYSFIKIDDKYSGAYLRYLDHEHTKIVLTYRLKQINVFDDISDIDSLITQSTKILDDLFTIENINN